MRIDQLDHGIYGIKKLAELKQRWQKKDFQYVKVALNLLNYLHNVKSVGV
jgi:hypothetical protein